MRVRKRPAPPDRPSRNNTTSGTQFIAHRRQDGYAAPTAQDRAQAAGLAAAATGRCPGCDDVTCDSSAILYGLIRPGRRRAAAMAAARECEHTDSKLGSPLAY